ncbi:MAG: hypothetical protein ACLFST_09705 [Spirochaetia bacterium]
MKKKTVTVLIIVILCTGLVSAQDYTAAPPQSEGRKASGLIRFNALGTLLSLAYGTPSIEFSIVPFISRTAGIPITVSLASVNGFLGIGILSGINITPAPKNQNDGLFISIEAGGVFIAGYFIFAGVFDIGYQYISPKGFVFTPAGGFKYNEYTGFSLDLMLDIGFTF